MKLRAGEKAFLVAAAAVVLLAGYYLVLLNGKVKGYVDPIPHLSAAAQRGENEYLNLKCDECHNVYGLIGDSGTQQAGAKNMGGEGARRSLSWITGFLSDPSRYNPGLVSSGNMVALDRSLTTRQIRDLAEFLYSLKAPPGRGTVAMPTM